MIEMTLAVFVTIFLSGLSLSADAFAVSICDGMVYRDLNKTKGAIIPLVFGFFQAFMPILGFYFTLLLSKIDIFDKIDHWVAFVLLLFIGGKMIYEGIRELRAPEEKVSLKKFSITEVLTQGVATSIDALAVGFSFGAMLEGVTGSIHLWAWVGVAIIGVTTFVISLAGVLIGVKVGKLFKKKATVAEILGGVILVGIGLKILIEGLL